jgi:aspartate/methionine/tyrosine aminotransferase
MENEIAKALEIAKKHPDFIDLMQTNFTAFKSGIPATTLTDLSAKYFANRTYNPDSLGLLKTRESISQIYQGTIIPEKILVTASTSESYSLLFNALTATQDEILLPQPGYPLFEYLAEYSKITTKFYRLAESNNWQPDLISITKQISEKTKGIVLISPNNPTGSIITKENLEAIINIAREHKLFIIFDEVFSDFTYLGNKFTRPITNEVPFFLLNGISKMLAMPDLKLAWIACNSAVSTEVLELLELANDTYLNANYLVQDMFPELLKNKELAQKGIKEILEQNYKFLQENLGQGISANLPQGGIHAVIKLKIKLPEEAACLKLLRDYNLSLHPGYFYDLYSEEPHFVISLLQTPEKFAQALSILQSFVIQYASSK